MGDIPIDATNGLAFYSLDDYESGFPDTPLSRLIDEELKDSFNGEG